MYTQGFNLFFGTTAAVQKDIFQRRIFFFLSRTCMNCRPAEYSFDNALFRMDIHALRRCNLVIRTTVTNHIDQSIFGNVIDKPRNLIRMSLYNDLVLCFWIDYPHSCTVVVNKCIIDIGLQII
ncbi:hypothetical protein D3C72_1658780 [compost metagenome]